MAMLSQWLEKKGGKNLEQRQTKESENYERETSVMKNFKNEQNLKRNIISGIQWRAKTIQT